MKDKGFKMVGLFLLTTFFGAAISCTKESGKEEKETVVHINKDAFAGNEEVFKTFSVDHLIPIRDQNVLLYRTDKIHVKDSLLYILDKKQKMLLVIDFEGRVKLSLKKVGNGPEEYLYIDDFGVDKSGNIYLFDGSSEKIRQYDAQGNLLKSIKACFGQSMLLMSDGRIAIHVGGRYKTNIVILDSEGNRVEEYPLEKEQLPVLMGDAACLEEYDGDLYYSNPLDLCIYKIKDGKQIPWLTFDFEDDNIPKQLLESKDSKEFITQLKKHKGVIGLKHWSIYDGKVIGTTNLQKTYCYDIKEGKALYLNNIDGIERSLFVSPWFVSPDGTMASYITAQSIFGLSNNLDFVKKEVPLYSILGEEESKKYMENDWILIGHVK